jgi:hypothetical protein
LDYSLWNGIAEAIHGDYLTIKAILIEKNKMFGRKKLKKNLILQNDYV